MYDFLSDYSRIGGWTLLSLAVGLLSLAAIAGCLDQPDESWLVARAVEAVTEEINGGPVALDPTVQVSEDWLEGVASPGPEHVEKVVEAAREAGIDTVAVKERIDCSSEECTTSGYKAIIAVPEIRYVSNGTKRIHVLLHIWNLVGNRLHILGYTVEFIDDGGVWRLRKVDHEYIS